MILNVDALSEKIVKMVFFPYFLGGTLVNIKGRFSNDDKLRALRRVAKFRENRCRDGGERVLRNTRKPSYR